MGILRSIIMGSIAWFTATAFLVHPEMALGIAVIAAFLSESAQHSAELTEMRRHGREVTLHLRDANTHIEELERALTRRHVELNSAIEEIHRRDAVGSPAARELLKRQEEAMTAASNALEVRHERNDVVLSSMERMLDVQVNQTAKMQQAMSDLLQHMVQQPRANVTMTDSVLVQENNSAAHQHREQFKELNEWLSRQAASSP
ncbi:MAG: hypothetical protein L7S48_06885 [Candidatus Poseidonia sp.]|nr:hypothetical protein [Poseidonia sp.]